jgi:hypothetical protein
LVEQGTFNPKVAGSRPARPITRRLQGLKLAGPESSLETAINLLGAYFIVIGALRLLQAADARHRRRAAANGAVGTPPA